MLGARLHAQMLGSERAGAVEDVVHRLLAVQAQDPRAFRLSIRARSHGLTAGDVDRALSQDRSVVVSWLCRGTLHLVGADDYWWLHALTAPRQVAVNRRRLAQLGVDEATEDAAVATILAAVASSPRSRPELGRVLADAGLPTEGQILVHLLAAASFRAHLVRGPVRDGEHCFVDASSWLRGPTSGGDHLALLAPRYLAGHGPATPADLAAFCGITVGDARKAIAALPPVDVRDHPPPPPRLLGMFDPVLHGWADRSFVLGDYPGVVTSNGIFRATVLVDGTVAGTWTIPDGVVRIMTARPLPPDVTAALEAEAADVARFLGLDPAPPRFVTS